MSATIRPRSARRHRIRLRKSLQAFVAVFGEDRWRFEAAGWCFIGLNSLIMNTGLASEAEQFDWLAVATRGADGKPIALFLHKPLFLDTPEDPELPASAIRYVPQPVRAQLVEMLGAIDLRLVASGHVHQRRDFTYGRMRHVWAPSVGFTMPERIAAGDGTQGDRACGLSLPARKLRGSPHQGGGPGRYQSG